MLFVFKRKTAYEMRISDWSSDVCSSDLFRRYNAGKRDRTVLLTLEAGRRDYPAFEGYTALLSGRIARESTPIWQKRWTWAYGAELIATNETRLQIGRASCRERVCQYV